MQIQTNYNTPTYTGKVTMFTMLKNTLSKTGRLANSEISGIQTKYPKISINQERVGDLIELSFTRIETNVTTSSRLLISKSGLQEKETNKISFLDKDRKFKLINIIYEYFRNHIGKNAIIKQEIQSIENTKVNKVEEFAKRTLRSDGSVDIAVTSFFGRESELPITPFAKNIHLAQAKKTVRENGDIIYLERYKKQ